jgi:hypothetical protein
MVCKPVRECGCWPIKVYVVFIHAPERHNVFKACACESFPACAPPDGKFCLASASDGAISPPVNRLEIIAACKTL